MIGGKNTPRPSGAELGLNSHPQRFNEVVNCESNQLFQITGEKERTAQFKRGSFSHTARFLLIALK